MGAVSRYAYVNARISVIGRRLLPRERIEALIERPTIRSPQLLEGTELGDLLSQERLDPLVLDHLWLLALLADFGILLRGLRGAARELLVYWLRRFELGNLNAIIRGKIAGLDNVAIREELVDLGAFAILKVDDLLATEDVAELLRYLERTPYSDVARPARAVYEERHDLFLLSATVDRRHYAGLARRVRAFDGEDRRQLQRLTGPLIDHINLVWLLRYRLAYDLPPAQAYYLLVPAGHRLSSHDWLRIAELGDLRTVIDALPPVLGDLLQGAGTISEVQRRLEAEIVRVARSILWGTAFNLARALAYLVLREMEMQQVLAVLKGRRLRLAPDLIRFAAGFEPLPGLASAGESARV